ncbi:MAG: DNA polymerase IV [Deltaproteobacteria bacterium]|nr:DNA polymerase IV [Deltaproteobacteria bacterium]
MGEAPPRRIIHLDLDSFFAAAEVLDNPALKGLPVIVGGLGPRGVVSTASYEARAFGARSGMPMGRARSLCPQAVFLPGRYHRYKELSGMVMGIFHRYTPLVEPLSLDEAFLDVTLSQEIFGPAEGIAERIRSEVKAETGLTVSAGVSAVKYVAKVASGFNKPDALTAVPEGGETDFLWPLPVRKLWGAGEVTVARLEAMGLKTIGDVAVLPEEALSRSLGANGARLWNLAWARDPREVEPEREAKSVGAEDTFDVDIRGEDAVRRELLSLSVRVAARLRGAGLAGSTLTLKLRDPSFKTITRSRTQKDLLDDHRAILALALRLRPRGAKGPFRLLGIQVSGLVRPDELPPPPPVPRPLFDLGLPPDSLPHTDRRLVSAMDDINTRFGDGALMPATLLERPRRIPVPETLPAYPVQDSASGGRRLTGAGGAIPQGRLTGRNGLTGQGGPVAPPGAVSATPPGAGPTAPPGAGADAPSRAEPALSSGAEPALSPGAEPALSPGAESVLSPGAESALSPGVESALSPGVESALSPGAESALSPGAEPAQPPGAEPVQPPGAEPVLPPGAGTIASPGADPTVAPGAVVSPELGPAGGGDDAKGPGLGRT